MKVSKYVRDLGKGNYDFQSLEQGDSVMAEYIWVGGSGSDLRSKARVLSQEEVQDINQIPEWTFDGSSTGQADSSDSEITLVPCAVYPDPFRGEGNVLVWCATFTPRGTPAIANYRHAVVQSTDWQLSAKQDYVLMRADSYPAWPAGFPVGGYPQREGAYYCGVGSNCAIGRQVMEAHTRCALHCGLALASSFGESMPGQWAYELGPLDGLSLGDQLWVSRYLLLRVGEHFGVSISFEQETARGWNNSFLRIVLPVKTSVRSDDEGSVGSEKAHSTGESDDKDEKPRTVATKSSSAKADPYQLIEDVVESLL